MSLASISIRKLDPAIAKYLIGAYGHDWPDDVELWEKVPMEGDSTYWIDVLSEKAMKEDEAGDPLVDQIYLSNMDSTETIRQIGKLIDAKKQEKSERKNGRSANSSQSQMDVAYLDGQIEGLRMAIRALQGKDEVQDGSA